MTIPIYDITKSWSSNIAEGPFFEGVFPERPKAHATLDLCGFQIASPLGVPAGPLLNSRWTTLAARLGFDVVTYKTIRSRQHPGHSLPNVIFVSEDKHEKGLAYPIEKPLQNHHLTITNSFGMPSMPAHFLQQDIAKARLGLGKDQVLIVSVVGTPDNSENVLQDFVTTALLAKDAGAHIIEANFSCPNICSQEGSLYTDPDNSYAIAQAIAKAIAPTPLIIKVGTYSDQEKMKQVLVQLARAGVQGVCGINSVSMHVKDANGLPALGKGRETSGICGNGIRHHALQFVRQAAHIIHAEKLSLEIIGCGGIMLPEHFDLFLNAGAKVALSATGMMWNPYLAHEYHGRRQS